VPSSYHLVRKVGPSLALSLAAVTSLMLALAAAMVGKLLLISASYSSALVLKATLLMQLHLVSASYLSAQLLLASASYLSALVLKATLVTLLMALPSFDFVVKRQSQDWNFFWQPPSQPVQQLLLCLLFGQPAEFVAPS